MNLEEIKGLATEDLKKSAGDAREDMFKRRFASATETVDNTSAIRELRKRIARINTVLRQRELAAAATTPAGQKK